AISTAARASATVWSDVARTRDLRRLELGRGWAVTGEAIAAVGLGVYAFTESGALAVAGVVALQMMPGALAAPLFSAMADRFRRERVMLIADGCRALLLALAAIASYQQASVLVVVV